MKIQLKDCTTMTCHFGVRFWIREKNTNSQLGNKIWTQDFDEVEVFNDSFFLRWRIILSVPSTKVFCVTVKDNYYYYASLLSPRNEEIVDSSFFVFLASFSTPSWKRIWFLLQKRSLRKVRKTAILKLKKKP